MSEGTTTNDTPNPTPQAALPREARMAALRDRVMKEDDGPAKEETTAQPAAEGTETPSADVDPTAEAAGESGASTADSAAADKDKADKDAAAKDKPKDDPKLAARFAALERKHGEIVKLRDQHAQATRLFDESKKAHEAHVAKTAADFEKREAAIRAREEERDLWALENPEKVVRWLGERLGITDIEQFKQYAQGKWQKPAAPKPEEKPFTKADADKYIAEQLAAAEKKREEQEHLRKAVETFETGFAVKDEKGSPKYRAAMLVFSKEDRIREGDRIGKALRDSGRTYASHEDFLSDVREAVNALAERDDRWQEIKKIGAPQVSGVNGSSAVTPAATPVADTNARQSRPGQVQPSKDEKKPTPPPAQVNGSSTPADLKAARKARLQRLMHG